MKIMKKDAAKKAKKWPKMPKNAQKGHEMPKKRKKWPFFLKIAENSAILRRKINRVKIRFEVFNQRMETEHSIYRSNAWAPKRNGKNRTI